MKFLIAAMVVALLSANRATAATNDLPRASAVTNGASKSTDPTEVVPDPNDPIEKEYQKLLDDDNASQAEVDKWIKDNVQFAAQGAGQTPAEMERRIRERFQPIKDGYESFLKRHPEHVRGRIAYASFLGDIKDEDGAREQLEKALPLAPKDAAIYNNLANIYGHHGPVKQAFAYYAKAIELDSNEPVYYQNFGTTVFLFRKDAMEFYNINEQQVFDKALELYEKAMKLAPNDFPLATDVAMTYYGIKPARTDDALRAWTNALSIAHDEIEREGVYIHFARIKLQAGRLEEARQHLAAVTNAMYAELKQRISRNVDRAENKERETNAPPPASEPKK